jgi:aminopeptidase N
MDSISDGMVLQTVLRQATIAARRFSDPARRQIALDRLAAELHARLSAAEPGSDRQLTYALAFTGVASSAADLNLLARLLDGSAQISGLAVDTDLRWRLLRRLVSKGMAGEDAIDAEHDRDRTDAGERFATGCLAAIPDPEAKAATWTQIVSGALPSATFRAALTGFCSADQDELIAPYAAKFFDVIADRWRDWGQDMAQYLAQNGYPSWSVTPEAIAMADDYLATADPPPALHRLLSEGRDGVARALRCQQKDAQAS